VSRHLSSRRIRCVDCTLSLLIASASACVAQPAFHPLLAVGCMFVYDMAGRVLK